MANEVKTIFTVDDQAALAKIANYKKELQSAGSAKPLGTPSASANDALMRKAQADIARYQKQTADGEKALTRRIEQESESRYRAQVRGQQRATSDILAGLRKIEAEEKRLGQSSASGRGFLTAGSLSVSQLAQGTLIGAAAYQGLNAAQAAIDRAVELSRANRLIASSATEAGIAQGVLAEKNIAFAKSVGISNREAAETTAVITRLATFSGNSSPERISQLLKAFADLGAARGIAGGDLRDLIGTILSGQDEGLNRLGIADPGILQKAYAKQLGITTEALTQQQKVQAATNAVLEKAGVFAGAAETRLQSLEGQTASSAAAWENLKDSLSKTFTESGPVSDFLAETNRALKELELNADAVNKKLAEGKTPRQIAEESYGPGYGDYLRSFATGGFGVFGILGRTGVLGETYRGAVDLSSLRQRGIDQLTDKIAAQQKANQDQVNAAAQTRQNDSISYYTNIQKQQLDALNKQDTVAAKDRESALTTARQKALDSLKSSYSVQEALLKQHLAAQKASEITSLQDISALKNRELQAELQTNTSYYNELIQNANKLAATAEKPEDRQKYQQDAIKFQQELVAANAQAQNQIKVNTIEAQTATIEKARGLARQLKDVFAENAGRSNPYVSIYAEHENRLENVIQLTKDADKATQDFFKNQERSRFNEDRFAQHLDDRVAASDLRYQADQFRRGLNPAGFRSSGAQSYAEFLRTTQAERIFDSQFHPSFSQDDYQAQRSAFVQDYTDQFANRRLQKDVQRQLDAAMGITYQTRQVLVNGAYRIGSEFHQGGGAFVGTFEDLPNSYIKTIREAQSSLGKLSEADQHRLDRKIIDITQGLDPSRLTQNERDIAAAAREREAKFTETRENEEQQLRTRMLAAFTEDGALKVTVKSGSDLVVIRNEAPNSARVTRNPTQDDTNARY